jgi:hypothetical protein
MLVGATGDWTQNTMQIEGPVIQTIYRLLGAPGAFNYTIVDSGHNYNKTSREHVYRWMGRWLLGVTDAEALREKPYEIPPQKEMLVFNDKRPRPDSAKTEEQLRDSLVERCKRQIEAMKPIDHRSFVRFQGELGAAFRTMFPQPPERPLRKWVDESRKGDGWISTRFMLMSGVIPGVEFLPVAADNQHSPADLRRSLKTVRVIHPDGIRGIMNEETGEPNELVRSILEKGYRVEAIDCFLTGDHMGPGGSAERALPESHAYTYNPTTLAYRVQDILTGLDKGASLVGIGEAGPWCLLAAACSDGVGRVAVDLNGFDGDDEASWQGDMFQPQIMKYGGLRTAASLVAPAPLFVHNTQDNLDADWVTQTYWMGGAKDALATQADKATDEEVVKWLFDGQ